MSQISRVATATIANGASLSAAIFIGGSPTQINMPAAWTAADLTFQVSADNVTYRNVFDQNGVERQYTVAASSAIVLKPAEWVNIQFLKIRSGTSGSAVNQGAARSIEVESRSFE